MHFRHISAKIQPQNQKQHFDWEGPPLVILYPWYHWCEIETLLTLFVDNI